MLPITIALCVFAGAYLFMIIMFLIRYKKIKNGFILVILGPPRGYRIVKDKGAFALPILQSHIYVPMEIFEIRTELGKMRVSIDESDISILNATKRFSDFSIDELKSQVSNAVKGIKEKDKLIHVLSEYGIKIIN